jgi:hypothetical protein
VKRLSETCVDIQPTTPRSFPEDRNLYDHRCEEHEGRDFPFYYGSTALYWALAAFSVILSYTRSVELPGRGISLSQDRYLHAGQQKHNLNAHKHPCLEWDSNQRSQRSSERRQFMPYTARPL